MPLKERCIVDQQRRLIPLRFFRQRAAGQDARQQHGEQCKQCGFFADTQQRATRSCPAEYAS